MEKKKTAPSAQDKEKQIKKGAIDKQQAEQILQSIQDKKNVNPKFWRLQEAIPGKADDKDW